MQLDLCLADGGHDRGVTGLVLEHANPEVNFGVAFIGGKKLAETQNRIRGNRLEAFKHLMTFQFACLVLCSSRR